MNASQALKALRKALGMTQTTFAVTVAHLAVTTVARYETSHPPKGDVLLRLAAIAEREAENVQHSAAARCTLADCRDLFRATFNEEIFPKIGTGLIQGGNGGYLLLRLEGEEEISFARDFLETIRASHSNDPSKAQLAREALEELRSAGATVAELLAREVVDHT